MWLSCLPAVALVVLQALMFTKKAVRDGQKMGVTKEQMLTGAKSAFAASIGPSLLIVIGMVGLLSSMGGPIAWMRLAYIGSVMYELSAADRAATAAGATLGTANMTAEAFANAVWVMVICSLGWILVSALFTDKMGVLRDKVAGNSKAIMGIISVGGAMGAFGYQSWDRAFPLFTAQTWAVIVGFATMTALTLYGNKTGALWTKRYGLTIAMVVGMLGGAVFL
jgi:hypothetical protein